MKLVFSKPHNSCQIHDELIAALPALRTVNGRKLLTVQSNGDVLTVRVPDGTDEAQIKAVIDAHVPRAKVRQADDIELERLQKLPRKDWTAADVKSAVQIWVSRQ